MKNPSKRLDHLLVESGLVESGAKARAHIMAGEVFVNDQCADKPGKKYPLEAHVELRIRGDGFVSRGGKKLAGALDEFAVDVGGFVALDIGSSTGGFTDCLLQRGAQRVYCVDVGKGLLDWRLRNDERVIVMEGINARNLTGDELHELVDIVVIDTSFISLTKIIPAAVQFLKPDGIMVPMVKPQFEVGRELVSKGGVVRDPALHYDVLRTVATFLYNLSLTVLGIALSPLPGPKGNREFFIHAVNTAPGDKTVNIENQIEKAVYGNG
jgi:23S rRNA (cytidine1920-2'-O)/16S rRNA (cytidine1409-2'-O)-methyltransferase